MSTLTIEWTDGAESTFTNIPADQMVTLSQVPGDCAANGILQLADLAVLEPCLNGPDGGPLAFACQCADTDGDGDGDLHDFAGFQSGF